MTLLNIFTAAELEKILEAIRAKEAHARAVSKRSIQGCGKASEIIMLEQWKVKADEWRKLESKVAANID